MIALTSSSKDNRLIGLSIKEYYPYLFRIVAIAKFVDSKIHFE